MVEHNISASELLHLEDRQLYYFLSSIRLIGEEKSDLYPEPQYFNASLMGIAANLPYVLEKIISRVGSAATFGSRARRVLSNATGLHFSIIATILTHGREMLLMEQGVPGQSSGVMFDDGDLAITDQDCAEVLRFAYDAMKSYRCDGRVYPSDTEALGSNFRILSSNEAAEIAAKTSYVDITAAQNVLGLLATVRALSFLMEAETREGLMMHGPYGVDDNLQLVIFECNDLAWPLFPNFPISGGARWSLPKPAFPTANLAIAFTLRDTDIKADRHGTLYIEPLQPENIVSAGLMTRGTDPYVDEGLSTIPIKETNHLRHTAEEIQEKMFMQVANWGNVQRIEAAIYQEEMFLLRLLAAAGFDRSELEKEQLILVDRCRQVYGRHFERILSTPTNQLPFFVKVKDFMSRKTSKIFTPFTINE